MNHTVILRRTIWICIIAMLLVVAAYVLNFGKMPVSDNSQDWGTFGDFFGGLLNPIIGVVNLVILVYITFAISAAEERRNQNEIFNQKKFALFSLKHDALKELNRILEQVQLELIKSDNVSELKIILTRNELNAYINTNSYLFPSFENDDSKWEPVRESIEKLAAISGSYFRSNHTLDVDVELLPELEIYNILKGEFLSEIQSQIIK